MHFTSAIAAAILAFCATVSDAAAHHHHDKKSQLTVADTYGSWATETPGKNGTLNKEVLWSNGTEATAYVTQTVNAYVVSRNNTICLRLHSTYKTPDLLPISNRLPPRNKDHHCH